MIVPLSLAVLAAGMNALRDLLQRGSMRADPGPRSGPVRLLIQLVRRPRWLAGVGASVLGLVLVFGEHVRTGPWLVGSVAGAVLLAAGTILLSRSPVLESSPGHESAPGASRAVSRV